MTWKEVPKGPRGVQADAEESRLGQALEEMGPNPLTEMADALAPEERKPDEEERRMEEGSVGFREALTDFLEERDHAFIGGLAVRSYLRIRPTVDYDVMIDETVLRDATRLLEELGGTLVSSIESTYTFHMASLGFDVDLRVARSTLDREALANARTGRFRGRRLRVVRPAHLAAMKVKAYSERKAQPAGRQDREDVLGLFQAGVATPEEVRVVLERHRGDLVAELDEICAGR